ncbi:hypothetical protein FACS1894201_00280 [Bacteroidia bacterium]|nr:hypothetical protein FACS1894201_00280 [Bacteroidia bacterium]
MIRSMTGFAKQSQILPIGKVIIEFKSLNSKQLDLNLRLSSLFRDKELEFRQWLIPRLQRGKVDVALVIDQDRSLYPLIDEVLLNKYIVFLKRVANDNALPTDELLSTALRMMTTNTVDISVTDPIEADVWQQVLALSEQTYLEFDTFRCEEGQVLAQDMQMRIQTIVQMLQHVEPHEQTRIQAIKERILNNFGMIFENAAVDYSRLEQELFYYLEKLDVTEEKVRLQKHCDYFLETMNTDYVGKKLGFVVQEIGREINTLGSKANDVHIQKIVVGMKDELEKIKEQLGNIL